MSLSPTLRTFRATSPQRVVLTTWFHTVSFPNLLGPGRTVLITSNQAITARRLPPTLIIVAGPRASPGNAAFSVSGKQPTLGRQRIVYPTLPESTPIDNDLRPTVIEWQPEPAPAALLLVGQSPTLIQIFEDNQVIQPTLATGPLVAGLAPTLMLPDLYEPIRSPRRGGIDFVQLAPTLYLERTVTAPTAMTAIEWLVIQGQRPVVRGRVQWQTVAMEGSPVWNDVAAE